MQGVRTRGGAPLLALGAALLLALWLAGSPAGAAASPSELACPSGQTVWLRGAAAPGVALLARFSGRDVGGRVSGADGSWAIPITVRERPGVYPVVVVGRQGGEVIAAFTCFVELPVGATATPTATVRVQGTAAAITPSNLPASTTPAATTEPPPPPPTTPAALITPSATAEPEATLPPTATSTTAPRATTDPTPSPTAPTTASTLILAAVQPDNPSEPGLFEYVIVENASSAAQPLVGWRLTHRETGASYYFPELTLPAGELLVVWSGDGQDDPDTGALYWPSEGGRWSPGQTAELHAPDGRIVGTLVVPPQDTSER
jgi:hypothetical protein